MVIEPDTCTDLAWVIALLAARTICSGDLAATPLPELPPQAASAIALNPAPIARPQARGDIANRLAGRWATVRPRPTAGPSPAHPPVRPRPTAGPRPRATGGSQPPAHRRSVRLARCAFALTGQWLSLPPPRATIGSW